MYNSQGFANGSSAIAPTPRPPRFEVGNRHAYITVMTYNVHGLPRFLGQGPTQNRYKDIGELLGEMRSRGEQPTVVLNQEAFVGRTKELREASGYAHVLKGPNASEPDFNGHRVSKILGSGLWFLSDFPIRDSKKAIYGKGVCRTWDCWANKGMQGAVIEIPGIPFPLPIFNTHMQSGGKYEKIRDQQNEMLWTFIQSFVAPEQPFIAAGDFNTHSLLPSYDKWMAMTGLQSVNAQCLSGEVKACDVYPRDNGKGYEQNPDQQFYRSGHVNGYAVSFTPVFAEHLFHEPYRGRLLSDHWAYNVTYEIKW